MHPGQPGLEVMKVSTRLRLVINHHHQKTFYVIFSHFLPFPQLHLNSRSEQGAATSLESNPTFIQCSCQRPNCTDDDKDVDRDGDDFDGDGESDSQAMHLQKLVCQGRKSQTSIFPPQKLQFVEPRKLRNFCSRILHLASGQIVCTARS